MRRMNLKSLALGATAVAAIATAAGSANSTGLEDVFKITADSNRVAQQSQVKIDGLSEETQKLLQEYKVLLKEIEGLRVYNAQVQRQIDKQKEDMAKLSQSIDDVTLIERQIMPLMLKMVDSLEAFVELDIPFLLEERQTRVERLRAIMDEAEVSASEKFRLVFEAYQIESDYGRFIAAYPGSLALDGREYEGDFLYAGRVGLYFQNRVASVSAMWNASSNAWEPLDEKYGAAIRQGIRISKGQVQPDLIRLPVVVPN